MANRMGTLFAFVCGRLAKLRTTNLVVSNCFVLAMADANWHRALTQCRYSSPQDRFEQQPASHSIFQMQYRDFNRTELGFYSSSAGHPARPMQQQRE